MASDMSFGIVIIILFSISGKFRNQYTEILGYKWNSTHRVIGKSWKFINIESMGKFCTLYK